MRVGSIQMFSSVQMLMAVAPAAAPYSPESVYDPESYQGETGDIPSEPLYSLQLAERSSGGASSISARDSSLPVSR